MKRPFPWLTLLVIVMLGVMNLSAQYTIHSQRQTIEGWEKLAKDCADMLDRTADGLRSTVASLNASFDVDKSTEHDYMNVVDHAPNGACFPGQRGRYVRTSGEIWACVKVGDAAMWRRWEEAFVPSSAPPGSSGPAEQSR